MKFRYRFKGKVNSQFVVRGALFGVGDNIDFYFTEKELEFAKEHCTAIEIIDREQTSAIEIPSTIPNETEIKIENKSKEVVKNGLQAKRTSNASKTKCKTSI